MNTTGPGASAGLSLDRHRSRRSRPFGATISSPIAPRIIMRGSTVVSAAGKIRHEDVVERTSAAMLADIPKKRKSPAHRPRRSRRIKPRILTREARRPADAVRHGHARAEQLRPAPLRAADPAYPRLGAMPARGSFRNSARSAASAASVSTHRAPSRIRACLISRSAWISEMSEKS